MSKAKEEKKVIIVLSRKLQDEFKKGLGKTITQLLEDACPYLVSHCPFSTNKQTMVLKEIKFTGASFEPRYHVVYDVFLGDVRPEEAEEVFIDEKPKNYFGECRQEIVATKREEYVCSSVEFWRRHENKLVSFLKMSDKKGLGYA
jgi:hypothetical protein